MTKPSKKILIYFLVVVLAFVIIYLGYAYGKKTFPFSERNWQVVQLVSGNVYYGHLKTFPSYKLEDVYFIQQVSPEEEGQEPTIQLLPLSSMFFGPENTMRLEKSQILWWADLSEDSQILQTIKNQ